MKDESVIRKSVKAILVIYIVIIGLVIADRVEAQEELSVEAYPVLCGNVEQIKGIVGNNFDTALLAGKSGVNPSSVVVLYNKNQEAFAIVAMISSDKLCILEAGRGKSQEAHTTSR